MASSSKNNLNYLTQQNGCMVVDQSSERERGPASSILSSEQKSLWVTSDKLPQQCTISLKKIIKKPAYYNTVGFYCWHQYDSNPALIEVWVRAGIIQSDKWQLVTKVRLSMLDTWQYFKIEDLSSDKVKQMKLKIMENFGDSKTYLNKVGLFFNPSSLTKESIRPQIPLQQQIQHVSPIHHTNLLHPSNSGKQPLRQKTYSEHHNPTSNSSIQAQLQKQLKKANDNIAYLTEQQQKMKKTIIRQQNTILKMQQILDTVLTNFNKLSKVKDPDSDRRKCHQDYNEDYQQNEKIGKKSSKKQRRNQEPNRHQIQNFKSMINQFQKQSAPKQTNFRKPDNNKNSSSTHKFPQYYDTLNKNDVIKANSQDDLSQYTQTQGNTQYKTTQAQYHYNTKNSNSKYNSNAKQSQIGQHAKILQKLQKLIILRVLVYQNSQDQKKKQLRKSAMRISQGKKQSVYEQYDDGENGAQHDYYQ